MGKYAGKRLVRTWIQTLGLREKYKHQTHELNTDLVILGMPVDTGSEGYQAFVSQRRTLRLRRQMTSPGSHRKLPLKAGQGPKLTLTGTPRGNRLP